MRHKLSASFWKRSVIPGNSLVLGLTSLPLGLECHFRSDGCPSQARAITSGLRGHSESCTLPPFCPDALTTALMLPQPWLPGSSLPPGNLASLHIRSHNLSSKWTCGVLVLICLQFIATFIFMLGWFQVWVWKGPQAFLTFLH